MPSVPHLRLAPSPEPESRPGQPVEFEALFERYARYVAGIAARLLGRDDHELDDVVQDVFWLASRRLGRITDMDAARGWLSTVTTRTVRRKLVRRRFRQFFHATVPACDAPAPGATPEERATLKRVYDVLDRLPIDQRLAWSLRYIEGDPLESVAQACGCSLATAKRRISAAQDVIQEVFRDA